jgi:benzylsuccinate CoA-transferase BbsF subunit
MIDGRSQANDADLHENGYYPAVPHPRAGVRHYGGLPFILDGERLPVRRAPLIGEHTEEVLLDLLHIPSLELSRLVADEAVGT